MTDGALYHDRESIQPRAFALRHLVIQDVKFRKLLPLADAERAALDRVARGVEVEYDAATKEMVVRCEGIERRRVALGQFVVYHRGDGAAPTQERLADSHHWDAVLERNRALAHELVTAMAARLAPAP